MPTYLLSIIIILLSTFVLAQTPNLLNFAPGALPSCANQCTALHNAQYACIPPAAPVTNQQIYRSCFCQSGFLASLYNTPTGLCDQACSSTDLAQIQSWYKGLCGQRAGVSPGSTVAGSSTSAGATSTSLAGARSSSTPSGAVTQGDGVDTSQQNWFGTHWRWVLMLIILFVGLALLALASVLLRRRYMRKKEARASLMHMSAPVESWYPHQRSVHDLGVAGYGMGRTGDMQRENEKGKGVVGVGVDEHRMKDPEGKRGRLKKGWLGGGR